MLLQDFASLPCIAARNTSLAPYCRTVLGANHSAAKAPHSRTACSNGCSRGG